MFGGTCHSFLETVPVCHEQQKYCWSRKKSKQNCLKGFGNSEEACSSTHTSRQSQFRIDRYFIESTNPIFRTGVLSKIFFFSIFQQLVPCPCSLSTRLRDFGLLQCLMFFLPAKISYENPVDSCYSRSVIFNFSLVCGPV